LTEKVPFVGKGVVRTGAPLPRVLRGLGESHPTD
jgi:hypothetical protein